jgi:hypothetical protein
MGGISFLQPTIRIFTSTNVLSVTCHMRLLVHSSVVPVHNCNRQENVPVHNYDKCQEKVELMRVRQNKMNRLLDLELRLFIT